MNRILESCIISAILILWSSNLLYAQDLSALSDAGYAHWTTANRLMEDADEVEEYILIAEELESVISSDPQFKDTYMTLTRVYEKIAAEKGEPIFRKAEQTLDKYLALFPSEGREVGSERTYIAALKEKYRMNIPMSFVGKWRFHGLEISHANGYFEATIESDNKYQREVVSITSKEDHLILVIRETYDGIAKGKLKKYGKNLYEQHYHNCGGKWHPYTKEVEVKTYKLYNKEGKNRCALTTKNTTLYSSSGAYVHSCTESVNFDRELERY